MRPPRLRLRLRTLLIAVAVAAMAMGGLAMLIRRRDCLRRANDYDAVVLHLSLAAPRHDQSAERSLQASRAPGGPYPISERLADHFAGLAAQARAEQRKAERLARAFRHVARYPWLPMPRETE